ncbi:MAG: acetylornithine transaminase [Bacillota bacterium]
MQNREIIEQGQKYLMNTYGRLPLALVRGQGASVWDGDGREYLDLVGGLAVNALGHAHPRVVQAVRDQGEKMFHCSNLYWIEPQVRLARLLVENSCLDRVFFANSGAEANEGAIKLARKYAKIHLGEDRYEIITMSKSFHGRTLATLTATGQEKYHQGYSPLPQGFKYASFNDLGSLEKALGPHTCAIMLEPIQGEGGVYPAGEDYLQRVRQLCDEKGLLLIFDEVQCGMGRTGTLFAYENYGVEPDIMTLAKALAGGLPIGALLAKEQVAAAFQPGDHASTFGGNPLVTTAAIAVLETIFTEKILDNVREMGDYLAGGLENLRQKYSCIKEIRGKGLMIGAELDCPAGPVVTGCRERGLLINNVSDQVLRFLPPLIITSQESRPVPGNTGFSII